MNKILDLPTQQKLNEVVKNYFIARKSNKEKDYYNERIAKIKESFDSTNNDLKNEAVRECIFFNLMGFDVSMFDFGILDVMALNDFSSKRVAYTAAAQIFTPDSNAVLMATNRIQRDLTAANFHFANFALSSFGPYLSPSLAQNVASEVIALMSSHKTAVRQKAIITFYHICLRYPEALKVGFSVLRTCLSDTNLSIIFTTLTVMTELCTHNAHNFVPLIPKFHKMITKINNNWIVLRLISLLKMLAIEEPRLPKRLSEPFKTVIETTSSASVVFEIVRAMLDIPIEDDELFTLATMKIESYLEHPEPNLRFLCMQIFVQLIKVQPKLVARHRELISNTLDSPDEPTRLIALELLCSLANEKTLDSIVGKMFIQFKKSKTTSFKDQLLTKVIMICSNENYQLVSDFDWYVSVLFDFIEEGNFTCYDIMARQLLDLARRVPSTRETLVEKCSQIFSKPNYRSATPLLLACSHIIGEYSVDASYIKKIIQPVIVNCSERVQASCVDTSFRLYLKSKDKDEEESVESLFNLRLPLFCNSNYSEVSNRATSISSLISLFKTEKDGQQLFSDIKSFLNQKEKKDVEYERPKCLDDQIDLFDKPEEEQDAIDEEQNKQNQNGGDLQQEENPIDAAIEIPKYDISKLKPKRRKQEQGKEKVVILDTESLFEPKKKQSTPHKNALSSGLAAIDLTENSEHYSIVPKEETQKPTDNSAKLEENEQKDYSQVKLRNHYDNDKTVQVIEEEPKKKRRRHHHHKEENPVQTNEDN